MSKREIGIEEARRTLGDLVDQVRYTGRSITLTRHGKPAVRIVPLEDTMTYTLISALVSDSVPGVEVSDPDCPIDIRDYPEAMAWAEEQGYGIDDPDELIYVLAVDSDEEIPGGFETYRLTVR